MKIHFLSDMDHKASHFCPPLGIGYLSSYIKRTRPNFKFSFSYRSPSLLAQVTEEKPDIVAISSTSQYFPLLRQAAEVIEKELKIPIIWGGVHISTVPHDLPPKHVGVIGEGENTLLELLDYYSKHGSLTEHKINSTIYYNKNRELIVQPPAPLIANLDSSPPPDLHLLQVEWSPQRRAVVMTSRGCPYLCSFCVSSTFWRKSIRFHSPQRVVNEFVNLRNSYGVNEILIYDDLFIADRKRLKKIAQLTRKNGLHKKLRFECLGRGNLINEEVVSLLKEMNVYRISMGLESGNPNLLSYHKGRGLTHQDIANATKILKRANIEVVVSVIIASLGETSQDIDITYRMLLDLGVDNFGLTICTPFPGTKLWEDSVRLGRITDKWSHRYYVLDRKEYKKDYKDKVILGNIYPKKLIRHIDKFEDLQQELSIKKALKSSGFPKSDVLAILKFFTLRKRVTRYKNKGLYILKHLLQNIQFKRICLTIMESSISRHFLIRKKARRLLNCPPVINIETTNHCQAHCLMCPHKHMNRKKGHMTMELFLKILKDLEKIPVNVLSLNLLGEPFHDPHFIERIEAVRANKNLLVRKLSFVTNASFMRSEDVKRILDLDVDEMIISFNGGDPESYRRVMGLNFEKSLMNISYLFREREKRGKEKPTIRINCIELKQNMQSQWFIKKFFQDFADQVTFVRPLNWAGYLGTSPKIPRLPCRLLWTDINILWDGRMTTCCRDWDGTLTIGDVNSEGIMEAWHGRKMKMLRRLHLAGKARQLNLCARCDTIEEESYFWLKTKISSEKD